MQLSDDDIAFIKDLREQYESGKIDRRDALKVLGGLGVGGLLGGGGYAMTQTAKADPSTSDNDGNLGTPSNPIDVFAEGLGGPSSSPIDLGSDIVPDTDATYDLGSSSKQINNLYSAAVNTEQINGTVNLTSLVEGGTYADIVDAIINEPPKHPKGTYCLIEPGDYTVTTTGTILWSDRSVGYPGSAHNQQESDRYAPVRIRPDFNTLASTDIPITVGDAPSTSQPGLRNGKFEGIQFHPVNGSGTVAVKMNGNQNRQVLDWEFRNCAWKSFGGRGLEVVQDKNNFGHDYYNCFWEGNAGTVQFGRQTYRDACNLFPGTSPGATDGNNSMGVGGVLSDGQADLTPLEIGAGSSYWFKNVEGTGAGTALVGPAAPNNRPTRVDGHIKNWDKGIEVTDGNKRRVAVTASFTNITNEYVDFLGGGGGEHDNSWYIGNGSQVSTASDQNIWVMDVRRRNNISAGDMPRGTLTYDENRGNTGTPAIVWVGRLDGGVHHYWDQDGTL